MILSSLENSYWTSYSLDVTTETLRSDIDMKIGVFLKRWVGFSRIFLVEGDVPHELFVLHG